MNTPGCASAYVSDAEELNHFVAVLWRRINSVSESSPLDDNVRAEVPVGVKGRPVFLCDGVNDQLLEGAGERTDRQWLVLVRLRSWSLA